MYQYFLYKNSLETCHSVCKIIVETKILKITVFYKDNRLKLYKILGYHTIRNLSRGRSGLSPETGVNSHLIKGPFKSPN